MFFFFWLAAGQAVWVSDLRTPPNLQSIRARVNNRQPTRYDPNHLGIIMV